MLILASQRALTAPFPLSKKNASDHNRQCILTLTCDISRSLEVVPALSWVMEIADCSDGLKYLGEGSGSDLSKVSFQFRERMFD